VSRVELAVAAVKRPPFTQTGAKCAGFRLGSVNFWECVVFDNEDGQVGPPLCILRGGIKTDYMNSMV
jgi:hypothetical protein